MFAFICFCVTSAIVLNIKLLSKDSNSNFRNKIKALKLTGLIYSNLRSEIILLNQDSSKLNKRETTDFPTYNSALVLQVEMKKRSRRRKRELTKSAISFMSAFHQFYWDVILNVLFMN